MICMDYFNKCWILEDEKEVKQENVDEILPKEENSSCDLHHLCAVSEITQLNLNPSVWGIKWTREHGGKNPQQLTAKVEHAREM